MAKAPAYEGLSAEMPAREAAPIVLAALWDAVLASEPGVAQVGDGAEGDARAVHDMRVAIRRLRSAMLTFSNRFPRKRWRALRDATRRLGRRLGEVRDADVHLAALRTLRTSASLEDRAGIDFTVETLGVRRRRALTKFASEFAEFDCDAFAEALDLG